MRDVLVVDANSGLRVAVEDEQGHEAAEAVAVAAVAADWALLAPDIYAYEVGNVVRRSTKSPGAKARGLLSAFELVEFRQPALDVFGRALDIALASKVSYYDATYVALAEKEEGLLWTEDKEILRKFPGLATDTAALRARFP